MDTFGDDHYVGIKEITMDMKVKMADILLTGLSQLLPLRFNLLSRSRG